VPYQALNATKFGVPQDRRRLFLMWDRKGLKTKILVMLTAHGGRLLELHAAGKYSRDDAV